MSTHLGSVANDLPGYAVTGVLRTGRHFQVLRAVRESDKQRVILKRVAEASDDPRSIRRLEREFLLGRELDDPALVRADLMLETARGPVLVFPDEGADSLSHLLAGTALGIARFFELAIDLADTLGRLHARGLVHKDINPSNIVIAPNNGKPRLIDFGMAMRLSRETIVDAAPQELEGTLAYIAPEQTGRLNRSIDGRSDLYSLGMTYYRMLCGRRAFLQSDPADLLHSHLTQLPTAPNSINPDVPERLSQVLLKLLAKDPEDRYQSAIGLAHDLRILHQCWQTGEQLALFTLAQHDLPEHLSIPERLYGREQALATLEAALANTTRSHNLLRLAGHSGIGKSALVRELARPVAGRHGFFVAGKFDQLNRDRPYSAIIQAFDDLLRRLLATSESEHSRWRATLMQALGANAQVILDLLPSFQQLLGPQPAVAALGLNEAQIRFNLLFRRFVRALARADAPLVLFFDDIQWADAASRTLLRSLLSDSEINHVLVIAAYRDNEVGPGHPLSLLFAELSEFSPLAPALVLDGLSLASVTQLVADTLRQPCHDVADLATIVHAKTGGNPFFVRQFLEALYRKEHLKIDPARGLWSWNLSIIASETITDNVADLVVERLKELPPSTLHLVKLAACIGNQTDLLTLALISEQPPSVSAIAIEAALRANVLVPVGDGYKYTNLSERNAHPPEQAIYRFQHDRVQQSAYSLIEHDERAALHGKIGELILGQLTSKELDGRVIEVVDHLNHSHLNLTDDSRLRLIALNLHAGRKAETATAFDAALHYLSCAYSLLDEHDWNASPALAFDVNVEHAQAAYLAGQYALSEQSISVLLQRALKPLDRVRVLELLINLYSTQLQYPRAIEAGLQALQLLGEKLPANPGQLAVAFALARTKWRLSGRTPEALLALPRMTDPLRIASLRVMLLLSPPAYFAAPNLLPLIGLRMLELTSAHGNAPQSAYGYALYGLLHCAVLGDMPTGLAWSQAALMLIDRLDARDIRGRVEMMHAGFVLHWNTRLTDTLPIFLSGAEHALDAGDIEHFGYLHYAHASYLLMSGTSLPKVADMLDHHYAAVVQHRHEKTRRIMHMVRQAVRSWQGIANPADEGVFDESANLAHWVDQRDATSLAYLYKYRMLHCLMHGDYAGVLENTRQMDLWFNGIMGMAYVPFYYFYKALSLIVLAQQSGALLRQSLLMKARWITSRLRRWSVHSPATLIHRVYLLDAEIAAASGKHIEAISGYEQAIAAARKHTALHDTALALERFGEYLLNHNAPSSARNHLRNAHRAYLDWGAHAWAAALQKRHSLLLLDASAPSSDSQASVIMESGSTSLIDVASFLRSARAISEQLTLSAALEQIMQAVMMNAAARRGALLLWRYGALHVMAEAHEGQTSKTMQNNLLAARSDLPASLINYVARAHKCVVIADAIQDSTFGRDPYVLSHNPRSLLCAPLLRNGELIGVIYLEHDLSRGVFSSERTTAVEMLCAQAAISAESARLYDEQKIMLEQQVEMNVAQARFVPQQFLKILGRQKIVDVRLGDCAHIEGSILFSDIRGFTSVIEKMSAEEGIAFVNAYLSEMEPAILAEGGFVDSYIGDAIMAIFDGGADHSLRAAVGMLRNLARWNTQRTAHNREPIRMGIGLATGALMLGTVGGQARIKCGVVGDTVNLAARVESLTKQYQLPLLISDSCYRALRDPERFMIREIDWITVVGRQQPLVLYEAFDNDAPAQADSKARMMPTFACGLEHYRAGEMAEAKAAFQSCLDASPDDSVASLYVQRCERTTAHKGSFDPLEHVTRK